MALAAMLSAQAYISLKDRIDHSHHHAHFANPLAGDVSFKVAGAERSAHHHDHGSPKPEGHHHHHDGDASKHGHGHSQDADGHGHPHSNGPADHQHGGDAAIVFLAAQNFVLTGCPPAPDLCEAPPQGFVSFNPRGPDHPPKPALEIRV